MKARPLGSERIPRKAGRYAVRAITLPDEPLAYCVTCGWARVTDEPVALAYSHTSRTGHTTRAQGTIARTFVAETEENGVTS